MSFVDLFQTPTKTLHQTYSNSSPQRSNVKTQHNTIHAAQELLIYK